MMLHLDDTTLTRTNQNPLKIRQFLYGTVQCHEKTSGLAFKIAKMLLRDLSTLHKVSLSELGQLKKRTFLAWLRNMNVA